MNMDVRRDLQLTVNDVSHWVSAHAVSLLQVLRNDLGLNGPKYGCGLGQCGACLILIDGQAARSCVLPPAAAVGKRVTTLEVSTKDSDGWNTHIFKDNVVVTKEANRAVFQSFLAGGAFGFVLRLFADVGISALERTGEVFGSRVAADVAIDAGAIDVKRAGSVFCYAGVWVGRHRIRSLTQSADPQSFSVSVFFKTVAATRAASERGTNRSDSIMKKFVQPEMT